MIFTYLIKVIFALICFQWQRVETLQLNETGYLCGCFNTTCVKKNITCMDEGKVRWMGLNYFGFRLMQNGTNCDSLANPPLIPVPRNRQCVLNFTIQKNVMEVFSGRELPEFKNYKYNLCNQPNAYFVANYDCVSHNITNDIVLDNLSNYNITLAAISLSSENYPFREIMTTGVRSCSCNLTVTSSKLLLRTYDNRLSKNQTLTLSYSNQIVIKSWEMANNMTEVMNRKYVPGPFKRQRLLLNWKNNANMNGGKLWIVIEAINGNITAICQKYPTVVPTSTFTTLPATAMSAAIITPKLSSIQTRSSAKVTKSAVTSIPALAPTATITSPSVALIQTNTRPATLTPIYASRPPIVPRVTIIKSTFSSIQTKASSAKVKLLTLASTHGTTSTSTYYHMQMSSLAYSYATSNFNTSTQPPNIKESREPTGGHANIGVIIGGVLGGLFALILLILCCLFFCKKKKHRTEPEKGTQPAKNTFKGSRITQGIPNGAIKGSKARNEVDAEKGSSFSITNNSLPPVPIGGSLINSQTNNGNHNKRDGYQGSPIERRENLTNDDDIGRLNKNLLGKLSVNGQRMVNDDVAPLTKNTVDREIIFKEQQINTSDTSTNIQEKKKKKKKKRKKKNTIEALLGEDDTSIA